MSRHHRRRRPAVSLLLALGLVLTAARTWAGGPSIAGAQASTAEAGLQLVQQTSWVGPSGVFQVVVSGKGLPAGAQIATEVHSPVRTPSGFEATVRGDSLGPTLYRTAPTPLSQLDPAATGTVTLSLPVDTRTAPEGGVRLQSAGVYPYVVRAYDAAGAPLASLTTHLLRLTEASTSGLSPLAVGMVVPLAAPAVPGPDGTPTLEATAATALEARISAVTARPEVPITLSPSPESLRLLAGSDAGGADSVTQLRSVPAGRQVLADPYAAIDTGAWVDSGLLDEMDDQYAAGAEAIQGLLGYRPDGRSAVVDRTVTPEALSRLRQLGVDSVVVPSGQLTPLGDRTATTTFAEQFDLAASDGSTVRAVLGDDRVAGRLAAPGDPVLAGHQALAELAVLELAQGASSRGLAVVPPDSTDPRALSTLLTGLAERDGAASGSAGTPMLSPVTLENLLTVTDPATTTTGGRTTTLVRGYESDPPASLGAYPDLLRRSRRSLAGLRSLVPSAPELTDPVARTVLSSGARTLDADQRTTMLQAADSAIADVTGEIVVPPEQVVTLTSSSGKVPLNLENRLQVPVTVRIVLSSAKLDFPEGDVITQNLDPATTTRLDLVVETRASGAFPLDVAITSADGSLPVASTRYTVRSTAISGVGLVLSVGAGLFLLVWWARHFRTARRARKLVGSSHPALSGNEPDGYAPPDTDPTERR